MVESDQPREFLVEDDLTGIVVAQTEVSSRSGPRPRDPNEDETRGLLYAGVVTLAQTFLEHRGAPEGFGGFTSANAMFEAVSLDAVMKAFAQTAADRGIDIGAANKARLLNRWGYASHYQRDLVRYVFRPYCDKVRMEVLYQEVLPGLESKPLGEMLDGVALAQADMPRWREELQLQQVLILAFPADPDIRGYAVRNYRLRVAQRAELYESIAARYGLARAASSLTWADLATVAALVSDGLAPRTVADPKLGLLDDGSSAYLHVVRSVFAQIVDREWADLVDLPAQPA